MMYEVPFHCIIPFFLTFLRVDRIISELLAHLERPDLHPFERADTLNNLRGIISAIWGADEILYGHHAILFAKHMVSSISLTLHRVFFAAETNPQSKKKLPVVAP